MDSENKNLSELPTIENSNTKQELSILNSVFKGEDMEIETKTTVMSTNDKTKLQDLYAVLVAMGLFILLANPWSLQLLKYISGNMLLAFLLSLFIFGGVLYIIYIFLP